MPVYQTESEKTHSRAINQLAKTLCRDRWLANSLPEPQDILKKDTKKQMRRPADLVSEVAAISTG